MHKLYISVIVFHVRLFLVDTVNFCFWSDSDVLFTVDYDGKLWTGYRALRAAFLRAMEVLMWSYKLVTFSLLLQNGIPIHKPSFYAEITKETLADIFTSATCENIPMLEERTECLQEAGTVLIQVCACMCPYVIMKSLLIIQRNLAVLCKS